MGDVAIDRTETTAVEAILRDELARGNRALRGVAPVISHMLESSGRKLVSDSIVARLRGMLGDLAGQLMSALQSNSQTVTLEQASIDRMSDAIAADSAVLKHLYALAMEGDLTERLEQRSSIDPVLTPLLQELIASDQPSIAELAMNTLTAQSRFTQCQRRMALPLGELPAELFSAVLDRFERTMLAVDPASVSRTLDTLKANYDEGSGRIGLLARLVSAMRGGAVAALELDHAGLALFASGMAALTKQPRDLAVLACHERQAARLALTLRAAGLGAEAIERQFLLVEAAEMLPHGITAMPPQRALDLLAASDTSDAYAQGAV